MLLRLVFFFFLDKSLEPWEASESNDTLSDWSLLVSWALALVLTSVSPSLSLLSASTALFLLFFWPEISSSSESSLSSLFLSWAPEKNHHNLYDRNRSRCFRPAYHLLANQNHLPGLQHRLTQALFFNTCRRKKLKLKDKTQAENSRKKLNLSEAPPSNLKNSRK